MDYITFKKIKNVVKKFNLGTRNVDLFEKILQEEPSDWLKETLRISTIFLLSNEKTKSERIVSPILVEAGKPFSDRITFFSEEELNVNPDDDLSGSCDFFYALHPSQAYMDAPIISIVESKDEDMEWGIAQCAAQLYAAKMYNEIEKKNIPLLYGAATDGIEWQFIRFQDNIFFIDNKIYTDLKEILGVWKHILSMYIN